MAVNALPHRQNETVFEAQVESIATGGAGVARLDGRAVFIPKTAPGDTIRFRIVKDKGKYLLGELTKIIQAGPARTPPPAPTGATAGDTPCSISRPRPRWRRRNEFSSTPSPASERSSWAFPYKPLRFLKMRTATACARDFRYGVPGSAFSPRAQGVCPESKTVCWWSPPSRTPSTRSDICSRRSRKRGKWKPWK